MCILQDQPTKPLMPLMSDMFIVICLFYMISPLSIDAFDVRHVYCDMCILQDQPTKTLMPLMSDMFIVICVFHRISRLSR